VTNERQRLTQKKQALVKSEMDKRKAELLKFSQTFKVGDSRHHCFRASLIDDQLHID
jgi:hypothetical protein